MLLQSNFFYFSKLKSENMNTLEHFNIFCFPSSDSILVWTDCGEKDQADGE